MTGLLLDDPAYFERLARADRSHWWSAAMWDVASAWLDFASRGQQGWSALDVGCGHGATLERLASRREIARVVGVEPSADAMTHHRSLNCEILQASAQNLPLGAAEFDLATCFDVFQHLPEGYDKIAACELRRVVRPGGWILVRANGRGLWPDASSSGKLYRLSDLVGVLEGAGLRVVRASYLNCLPGIASEIAGKLRPRSRHGHPSGRGLRIEPGRAWTGRLMGIIAGMETMFAGRRGGRLPIGHSTMVLAQNPNPGGRS